MDEHPVIAFVRSKVPDPGRPFTIIANLTAHSRRGGEVAVAIAASGAVSSTLAEPGCPAYEICQDVDSPDHFIVYERWRDLAALGSHLEMAHFAAVGSALGGLLAGVPSVRVLTPVAASASKKMHNIFLEARKTMILGVEPVELRVDTSGLCSVPDFTGRQSGDRA